MAHAQVTKPAPESVRPTPEAPKGPGRPTKLDPFMLELARRCGKAGLIDEQVAIMLDISVRCFYNWTKDHPEFLQAVKAGQNDPAARTRNTLFQKANGFTVPEEKVFLHEGQPVRVETYRYIPPSDTALIFWLCNKLPEEFKHVQHIQNAGGVDVNLKNTIPTAFAAQMERVLKGMGEAPASAPAPAKGPGKPSKAAKPARSQDLDEDEEIPLEPSPVDEDPNPPTDLDLSDLESGDE